MMTLPVSVLAWEGPQARAYLAMMRRHGMQPERIILMVRDLAAERRGRDARSGPARWLAARRQDRAHNFHPYAIRRRSPELVDAIAEALAPQIDDPQGLYRDMYERFDYADFAPDVVRIGANSYRDPGLRKGLERIRPGLTVFTGGGLVPKSVLSIDGLRLLHIHTGLLPHVRGADVLLWSMLVRGRPAASAFMLVPELDEGDVVAAREFAPLRVRLPAEVGADDDTLYRATFSFIDPLLRADLLVRDVLLANQATLPNLATRPQDVETGVTYHFMHPVVRAKALRHLFDIAPPEQAAARDAVGSPIEYAKFYKAPSARAAARFVVDANRAGSTVRAQSIRNRQTDYAPIVRDRTVFDLHRRLNEMLARQTENWASYDYGEGYFYQSFDRISVTGLRDTAARVAAFGLEELVEGRTVLEIGCNTGFLSLSIASAASSVFAFELNPHLIEIAETARRHLAIDNVEFAVSAFEDLTPSTGYEAVLSFANHHTYDGNTRQSLEQYFDRCRAFTAPGGRFVFESHPPELEGSGFAAVRALIEERFTIESESQPEYGTFLDRGRRLIVATRPT